ncbi:MAG: SpoIVB peptidase S55 domain-containing protein [Nannocystales bacterium]
MNEPHPARRRLRLTSLGALAAAGLAVGLGFAAQPEATAARKVETMPVSDVRPGMRGHAVTVFKGEHTDKFEVEIVDVIHNYLPKQDAVLFKSNDPRMVHSSIVGGMSGSPIFIEGKLVGALSYGWPFNKDALGALTPISNMHQVGDLPYRPDVLPHPETGGKARGKRRRGTRAWADAMLGLETSPLPARRRADDLDASESLVPLSVPLSISGLGADASRMLGDALGMTPVRGGGRGGGRGSAAPSGGTKGKGETKGQSKGWSGGDSVSVILIDGDSSVAGNGTVTWVNPKGDRLLAFGHSMFDAGPTNVPMGHARVHTIINSYQRSVKVSSPLSIDGLMYQDRQAAIALRTDKRAPMIPVTTNIQGPDADLPPRTYNNRVSFGVDLTPNLVASILAEALDEAGRDSTEVVFKLHTEIEYESSKGRHELEVNEEVFFSGGLVGRIAGRTRSVLSVLALLDNDFEVAAIKDIRHDITMEYGAPVDQIENVRFVQSTVRAGDLLEVEVTFRNYDGDARTEIFPIRVPDDAAGEQIVVELAAGDLVVPLRPLSDDLDDLITTLTQSYPSRSVVATIYREGEGLATREGLMPALPDSVLETMLDRGATRPSLRLKQMSRRVIPTKSIVVGTHRLKLDVKAPKSFR